MPDRRSQPSLTVKAISDWLDVIVKIGVIAGAVLALQQYVSARYDLRSARTLDYITRFDAGDLARSRRTLDAALVSATRNIGSARITPQLHERLARMIAYDTNGGNGTVGEISDVAGFFDSLQSCIDLHLCDAAQAHVFFDPQAKRLWVNFQPFILEHRAWANPGYAAGLEHFVASAR